MYDWRIVEKIIFGQSIVGSGSLLMKKFDRADIACLGSSFVEVLGCRILRFSRWDGQGFFFCGPCAMALVLDSGTPAFEVWV